MPPIVITIIGLIESAIRYAPDAIKVVAQAKQFFQALLGEGVISVAQQNALNAHVDAFLLGFKAGVIPPAWIVEADPK
jgi:hypothetical protein